MEPVVGPHGKFRVNPSPDGRLFGQFDHDELARRAAKWSNGNIEAADALIRSTYDEEAYHGAWLNSVRQDWLAGGGRPSLGPFDKYVADRNQSVAQDIAAHIETLPPAEQARAKDDVVALLRLYERSPELSDADVWDSFKNRYAFQKRLAAEGTRQMSQLQRTGGTTEMAHLAHLDPGLHSWYVGFLNGIRQRVQAGEFGPAFLQEIAATHAVMSTQDTHPGGPASKP